MRRAEKRKTGYKHMSRNKPTRALATSDQSGDMVIDDDREMAIVANAPITETPIVEHMADETRADALAIVADIAQHADKSADTATGSITSSAVRYRIAERAARIMIRERCGTSATALYVTAMLERHATMTHTPVPRVWRDLMNMDHALKCWIPGTVASIALPFPWPAVKRHPFYRVPDMVRDRSVAGKRGYDWGGMICDYWSRIDPRLIDRLVIDRFDELTDRATQREYLRRLMGNE